MNNVKRQSEMRAHNHMLTTTSMEKPNDASDNKITRKEEIHESSKTCSN